MYNGGDRITGYTQGTYDLFHKGHLNLIRHAKEKCDYLVVGINSDQLVSSYKGHAPVLSEALRVSIVAGIDAVDGVLITDTLDKRIIHERVPFQYIFIGDDWRGNERWTKTEEELKPLGAEVVYLSHTPNISTSMIFEKININS